MTDSLFEQISDVKHADLKRRSEFKPWHKPRKQWIRRNQWLKEIDALVSDPSWSGDNIHYLGLPGSDLLDLRMIAKFCKERELSLQYLGFNDLSDDSEERLNQQISVDELKGFGVIHPDSDILLDKFEAITEPNSVAEARLLERPVFDVVNLDLCDSFLREPPGGSEATKYNAISRLITHQLMSRKPWVLFLTTRCAPDKVHRGSMQKFLECILDNMQQSSDFTTAVKAAFNFKDDDIRTAIADFDNIAPNDFFNSYGLGFCKWLLHFLASATPPCTCDIKSAYHYQIFRQNRAPDMLSLAIRIQSHFEKPYDRHGLASNDGQKMFEIDHHPIAIKMVERLRQTKSVDTILDNKSVRRAIVNEAADLLEAARYDRASYIQWANG